MTNISAAETPDTSPMPAPELTPDPNPPQPPLPLPPDQKPAVKTPAQDA